jgi:hypothetical protein
MIEATNPRLDRNWRSITAELDAPRPSRVERTLGRMGVPAWLSRLVLATPALRRAWFLAIGVAVLVGIGAAQPDDPQSLFTLLLLAPTVPVLGVALAFGPAADPMYEAQLATPMRGIRLVAIRAVTVLVVSIVVIGALAALTPATRVMAAAWMLPALALTSVSLALMTVLAPRRAAAVAGLSWFVIGLVVRGLADDALATFGVVGQMTAVVVALAAGAAMVWRRSSYDRMEYVA